MLSARGNPLPGGSVPTVTINQILANFGAERALVVKVDIEGGEAQLFRSATEWLDRTDLLIIELHDWLFPGRGTSESFFRALVGRKFEVVQRGESMFIFFN